MPVRLKVVVPVQLAVVTVEVVVPRVLRVLLRTAPVVAVRPKVVERTIGIPVATQEGFPMNSRLTCVPDHCAAGHIFYSSPKGKKAIGLKWLTPDYRNSQDSRQ